MDSLNYTYGSNGNDKPNYNLWIAIGVGVATGLGILFIKCTNFFGKNKQAVTTTSASAETATPKAVSTEPSSITTSTTPEVTTTPTKKHAEDTAVRNTPTQIQPTIPEGSVIPTPFLQSGFTGLVTSQRKVATSNAISQ
jgi:cytoskeletal protein RodZ